MSNNNSQVEVILVDRQGMVTEGIHSLLNQEKHMKVTGPFKSAELALKYIEQHHPDVVITELALPEMDGLTFTAEVRKLYPDVQVILLTGDADRQYVQKAFRAGVMGYVSKDDGIEELVCGIYSVKEGNFFVSAGLVKWFVSNLLKEMSVVQQADVDWHLTERELETLEFIGNGHTNEEIAERMFTSKRTIEGYRNSLIRKTGARNTAALVKLAAFHNLLSFQEVSA